MKRFRPFCEQTNDPVHENEDGWYFWDECWTYEYGPYDSEDLCNTALSEYCEKML